MKRDFSSFRLNFRHPAGVLSIIAFSLSVVLRIAGYADRLGDPLFSITQIALPTLSALCMILVMIKFGQKSLWLSIFPVFLGLLSFMFKLFIDPRKVSFLHHFAAIVLYIAIGVLWALTVFKIIKTKWILVILFLLPFVKHVLMDDLPVLLGIAPPITTDTILKELCMLLTMLALSLCAAAFED